MKTVWMTLVVLLASAGLAHADCPDGKLEWYYYWNGHPVHECGCTIDNPDYDGTGKPIPWIVDKSINLYISGGSWDTDKTLCVQHPWFYLYNDHTTVNGIPNGFTANSSQVQPIGSENNFMTMLNDSNWWCAKKTYPAYISGQKLGTTYKNYCTAADEKPNTVAAAPFSTLARGSNSFCSLENGKVTCSEYNSYTSAEKVQSIFADAISIVGGGSELYAIKKDGSGFSYSAMPGNWSSNPVPLPFSNIAQLASSGAYVYALLEDGTIKRNYNNFASWDNVWFSGSKSIQISADTYTVCGLSLSGDISCSYNYGGSSLIMSGATQLVSTHNQQCALVNGLVHCWYVLPSSSYIYPTVIKKQVPVLSPTNKLISSRNLLCAAVNGTMKCIEPGQSLTETVPLPYGVENGFQELAEVDHSKIGYHSYKNSTTCAKTANKVRCWGKNPSIMGPFENLNGTPTCNGPYASCAGTSFGIGIGNLTLDSTASSTPVCIPFSDPIPSSAIDCSSGKPAIQFPQATCNDATQTKPTCSLGSPRCNDSGLLACGGFAAGSIYSPICKSGLPTCEVAPKPKDPYGN